LAFLVTDVVDRNSHLWQELHALPKVELHRHLEGSIRLETLCEVGEKYGIPLPAYDPEALRPHVQMIAEDDANLMVFLEKFGVLRQFFLDQEVISRIAREVIEDAAAENIRYMELRFTPVALAKARGFSLEQVIGWVASAIDVAQRDFRIKVRLIVSMNRHEGVEMAQETLDAALKYRHSTVVGLDLAGKEPGFPAHMFRSFFSKAQKKGLGVTIHAGEWEGPQNVHEAITNIKAQRIGHGVRVIEDSQTATLARERGIVFEVCPTSNIQTGVVDRLEHHPLLDMFYLDLPITINTDDPAVSSTSLTDEYALAVDGLGLTTWDVKKMILTAARSAFLPDDERDELVTGISRELGASRYRGLE
jgi:adenosine deaminase